MTKKNCVAKAVTMAIAGTALAAFAQGASATSTTMYNLSSAASADFSSNTTPCAPCNGGAGTDGWVWGLDTALAIGFAPQGSTNSVAKWAGTAGLNTTPFGYNGGAPVNWALHTTANGDTAEISSQDSVNRYGFGADIDTAKGAWSDAALSGASGWRHDLDFGLFMSDVATTVTLTAQGINQVGTNFGFTIFKGMDQSTGGYNHHGGWNTLNNSAGLPAASLPGGNSNFDPDGAGPLTAVGSIVAYSVGGASPSNLNTIQFNAEAGQIYTIVLGGYRNGGWVDTVDGYKLTATTVPVPGAVWLFGSAIAAVAGARRRKAQSAL